ncbi:MAG: M48 family metalloprotease [Candidatus Binatia bacterium]
MWNTRTPHAHDLTAGADGPGRRTARAIVVATCLSLAAVVAVAAAGCAVNPVTHRPELAMVSRSTELELGSEQAKSVAAGMGLLDDAAIAAYVRAIGARLAARSPRADVPYAFHVVDTPEPNAFAIPGHVYVTRGLLVLLNEEDELAGVLAHEVGHIAARHAVQRLSRALPAGIVTGIVSGVTGLASPLLGSLFQAGGDFATDALLAPYSRDQEREADRVGQEMAARSGWDPVALAHALATLERFEATETKSKRRPSFLDSHPSTPERAHNTAAYAATLVRVSAAPIVPTRGEFLARLDGLVVGLSAAQGVFDGKKFLHPDLGFHLRFPTEWKTANAATQVAGMAGDGRTIAVLSLAAEGNDPMLGVRAFERSVEEPVAPRVERTTINGLPAAHLGATTQAEGRRIAIEIWWMALGDHVYQLTGLGAGPSPDDDRAILAGIADSFGALTQTERAGIREDHLRLVQPKPGETLAVFTNRTGTPWSSAMVAIANGLATGTLPSPLRPLKVAVREPYEGKPPL